MCTGWLALTLLSVLSLGTQAFNSWLVKCFEDPQYEEMVWLAQDRLGQAAERKQIVVIGRAWQGSPLPRPCRMLATRACVGGRIETDRVPGAQWYVELGAMRIPANHRLSHEFIRKFGLKLKLGAGQRGAQRMGEVQAYPRLLGYQVRANEEWKTAEQLLLESLPGSMNIPNSRTPPSLTLPRWRQVSRFVRIIHSGLVVEELKSSSCSQVLEKYDSFSTKGYLIKSGNLSRGAVQMTGDLPNADVGYYEAFLETLHAITSLFQEPQFDEIAGGFDQLPQALHAALLPGTVQLHSPAEEVESYGDHIHVTYRMPDPLQTGARHLSPMATGTHCDPSTTAVQPNLLFIFYANHIFPNGTGVILASYTLDDDSSFFAVMDEEVWALCPYSTVKHWSQDPYSMGGFASFTPHQYVNYAQELCKPEGQVHFAGEHTTLPPSWIDTAIKSGLRATQNIQEARACFLRQSAARPRLTVRAGCCWIRPARAKENRLLGAGRQPRSSWRTPGTPECPASLSRAKPEIEPDLQKQGQSL
ncbi:hypothetical protein EI555_001439 [Monodon monoceros]|uniref:Amine oxidase domain-containing protein n=1 Tax=Monodon monoceros TaxID=40151 RepID=A0A4U1ENJ5_MONMO|nr:hypothetical protein EI555_001439 [Monodon monoceros]